MAKVNAGADPFAKKRKAFAGKETVPLEWTQKTADEHLPAGASIWISWGRRAWCGHYPPFARISNNFEDYGEHEACLQTLRELWHQALKCEGLQHKDCPIPGLF